jgi:hypothetical protein
MLAILALVLVGALVAVRLLQGSTGAAHSERVPAVATTAH